MSLSYKLTQTINDVQTIARYEGKTAVQFVSDFEDGETTFTATGDEAGVTAAAAFLIRAVANHRNISVKKAGKELTKLAKIMPDPAEDA